MLLDFLPATRLTDVLEGARIVQLIESGTWSEALKRAEMAAEPDTQAGDSGKLLLAVLQAMQGQPEQALTLILRLLPYLQADRTSAAYGHLVGAAALLALAREAEAAHWCSVALEAAVSRSAQALQVPILCIWAQACQRLGQDQQAQARVRRSLRLAKEPPAIFWSHATAAQVWQAADPAKASYHQERAEPLAQKPWQKVRIHPPTTKSPAPSCRPVMLHLLQGTFLVVGDTRVSAARSPRAALLLCYLVQHDGEALDEIAAQILPPDLDGKDPEQGRAHRVARVRQHLRQARMLLGDDAGVVCRGGRLYLGQQYTWDSDLRLAVRQGRLDPRRLLPALACPWLDELRFVAARL